MDKRVLFQPSGFALQVAAGERLLDALDDSSERADPAPNADPPITFPLSCRGANCGQCRVRVLSGAGALREASSREATTLAQLTAAKDERLACQIVVTGDATDDAIELEWLNARTSRVT
jgi:ferredoxin